MSFRNAIKKQCLKQLKRCEGRTDPNSLRIKLRCEEIIKRIEERKPLP